MVRVAGIFHGCKNVAANLGTQRAQCATTLERVSERFLQIGDEGVGHSWLLARQRAIADPLHFVPFRAAFSFLSVQFSSVQFSLL